MSTTVIAGETSVESAGIDQTKVPPPTVFTTPPSKKSEVNYGRVRRRNTTDESSVGPVLRTNVKPVKRFRPDSSPDKSNPSPSRRKKSKSVKDSAAPSTSNDKNAGIDFAALAKSPDDSKGKKVSKKTAAKPDANGKDPPKKKRVWEQWSIEDKNCFFDAVSMYGKDFEAVTAAVALRHKKRGEESMAKTKDQVRHLYYRTWTTISKLIPTEAYPEFTNRAFREMSAVVNYGEIHKRLGGTLSMKKLAVEKLNELVQYGSTNMRIKGKNFRIKTPSCQALKKINRDAEMKENNGNQQVMRETRRIKVPLSVPFELLPVDMTSWMNVQSLAQNPRLRVNVPAHNTLAFLFDFLTKKWDPNQSKSLPFVESNKKLDLNMNKNKANRLTLQTPSECSVNERLDVVHVTVTKTHCVVTYYLNKAKKSKSKNKPDVAKIVKTTDDKKENKKMESEKPPEVTVKDNNVVDITQSDDCLSMTSQDETMDESSSSPKTLDTSQNNNDAVAETKENDFIENISLDDKTILEQNLTITEDTHDTAGKKNEISAATNCTAPVETLNGTNTPNSMENVNNGTLTYTCTISSESEKKTNIVKDVPCNAAQTNQCENKNSKLQTKCENNAVDASTKSAAPSPTDEKIKCKIKIVKPKVKRKRTVRIRANKTQLTWTQETSESITIAEIFMMLGKPSVIKLYYKWQSAVSEYPTCINKSKKGKDLQMSTGLGTLLQLSKLLLHTQNSKKSTSSKSDLNKMVSPPKTKQNFKSKIKLKDTAIQCDLIKQPKNTSGNDPGTSSSNPRGRGVNKFVSLTPDFVVPRVPRNRPIASNGKPKQTLSEEALQKLMQRARSSKSFRRPIEHQSIIPKPVNNIKKMISYSIVPNVSSHSGLVVTTTALYKPIAPRVITTSQSEHFKPISSTKSSVTKTVTQAQTLPSGHHDIVAKAIDESKMKSSQINSKPVNDIGDILSMAAEQTGLTSPSSLEPRQQNIYSENSTPVESSITTHLYPLDTVRDSPNSVTQTNTTYATLESKSINNTTTNDTLLQFGWSEDSMTGLSSQLEDLVKKMVNPRNDVTLTSLSSKNQESSSNESAPCLSPPPVLVGNFDKDLLGTSPSKNDGVGIKSNEIPAHPWTISMASRDGLGLTNLLNTPQKVFPSDAEDSVDGYKHRRSSDRTSSSLHDHSSLLPENEVEMQLQCMLNENSVDYVSKFQELVRHTQQEEEFALVDTNSRDVPDVTPKQVNTQTKNANDLLCANLNGQS